MILNWVQAYIAGVTFNLIYIDAWYDPALLTGIHLILFLFKSKWIHNWGLDVYRPIYCLAFLMNLILYLDFSSLRLIKYLNSS